MKILKKRLDKKLVYKAKDLSNILLPFTPAKTMLQLRYKSE